MSESIPRRSGDERFDAERRADPARYDVRIMAKIRESGSAKVDVVLENLSHSGFRCDYRTRMDVGDLAWVAFAGLTSIAVKLTRREGKMCGFAFLQPLNVAVLDHIVAHHRVDQG